MDADAQIILALSSGVTACVVAASRAWAQVSLARIRASISNNAQEYAMLEKVATKPRRVKAAKADPVIPYGL